MQTNYLALVGPGTFWDKPSKPDSTDSRIIVVDVAESGIAWAEPKDLAAEEFLAAFERSDGATTVQSPHQDSFNVALADRQVVSIPKNAPRALVETLIYEGLTPQVSSGLEKLRSDPMRHIIWRLLVWVAAVVAFGLHAFRFRRGKPGGGR